MGISKQRIWDVDADEFMSKVTPAVKQSRLVPYWGDITKLRSGKCTLGQVCDFLDENGVEISIAGLSQYIKRRQRNEGKGGTPETAIDTETSPPCPPRSESSTGKAGSTSALVLGLHSENPLKALSGSREPGEFSPVPTAKIEFEY